MKALLKLAPLCMLFLAMLVVVSSVAPYQGPQRPREVLEKAGLPEADATTPGTSAPRDQLKATSRHSLQQPNQMDEVEMELQRMQREYLRLMQPPESQIEPQQIGRPANDNCANATPLTDTDCPFTVTQNNRLATIELGEPTTCCGSPLIPTQGQSVWYTFTNTTGNPLGVTVSTAGSNYDTVLQVYTGSCGNFAPILCGCNDDANPPVDVTSRVAFVADPSVTYSIKAAARGRSPAGILTFSLDCFAATATGSPNPASASNPVGSSHSITTTVADSGMPQAGVPVTVKIISGPNAGSNLCTPDAELTTDLNGQITFTYTSNGVAGTDTIEFCGVVNNNPFKGTATKCWDTFTCPGNLTTSNDSGQCSAVVNYTTPQTVCGQMVTCTPASGSTFPLGTTMVDCSAGGGLTCSFTVTVQDTEAPVLTCPTDITQNNDAGQCSAVVTYTAATVIDNCDTGLTATCTPASGSTFPVGTTTVTCTATDMAGNTGMCSFTVTVNDTEAPTITCPTDITQGTDPGQCSAVVSFTPTATDNCPNPMVSCTPASGSTFSLGMTTVNCTVTDAGGNTATCSFTVTVNDAENPTVTCPADITQNNDAGQCSAVVTYTTTVTDNCDTGLMATCTPASGSTFPAGTTTVTCTATDTAGNTGMCSFTVTVQDTEAPTLTCPANITQNNDAGQCSAVVTYMTATATDNCDTGLMATCTPASGSTFPVGTTTVTCTATDTAGNTGMCSFTVTVNDTENPIITCPADIMSAECGVPVMYAPTVTDNCPGAMVVCNPPSGSTFPVGMTTVICTATDASGNSVMCSFTVTAADTTAPTLTCPSDITTTCASPAGAVVTFTATATDACDSAPMVTCTPASGSTFPLGTTPVTCTATDVTGNTSMCSFTVTVNQVMTVLQDDSNGNCLTIMTCGGTGTYCFQTPSGSLTGPVVVSQSGSTINIQSGSGDANLIQGGVDLSRRRGNARLAVPGVGTFTIRDSNIDNSVCMCP